MKNLQLIITPFFVLGLTTLLSINSIARADVPATQPAEPPQRGLGLRGAGQGSAVGKIREVLQSLNLTQEQSTKIREIMQAQRKEMQDTQQSAKDLPAKDRRDRLREQIADTKSKIVAILNDDQKKKFEDATAQLQEDRKAGQGRIAPGEKNPSTQPTGDAAPVRGVGGLLAQRIKQSLEGVDLTADQQTKVDAILKDSEEKFTKLRENDQGDPQIARDGARKLMQDIRDQISAVLTPDQRDKVKENINRNRPNAGGGAGGAPNGAPNADRQRRSGNRPNDPNAPKDPPAGGRVEVAPVAPDMQTDMMKPATTKPNMMKDEQMAEKKPDASMVNPNSSTASKPVIATTIDSSPSPEPGALDPGSKAPDFKLTKLDGKIVQLSSYKGKPLVIVFGSYSCPIFRDKAAAIDELRKDNKQKANFLIIYTREAHALGEWEVQRNNDDNIKVEQPKKMEEREQLARMTRDGLKLTGFDFACDTLDNTVATAYKGLPNGAVVINGAGNIVGQLKWAEVFALQRLIDESLKK